MQESSPQTVCRRLTRDAMSAMHIAMGLIARLDRSAPQLASLVKRCLTDYLIPFNRAAGIRIVHVSEDAARVVIRLKNRSSNQNPAGTVNGGVILALAETAHGVAVMWRFVPGQHRMFTKSARIEYRTPGRGELFVDYGLPQDLHSRIENELTASNRSEVELESVVTDVQGRIVAELSATYVVQRRPGPAQSQEMERT